MEDAFNGMLDMDDCVEDTNNDHIILDEYNAEMRVMEEEIKKITIPDMQIVVRPPPTKIVNFDASNNVLDPDVYEEFKKEIVFEETHIFTQPISTTNTMEGYLSNVTFHEKDLIEELIPDEDLILYRCNYGKIKYDGYTEPVKVRRTNRGRKKKEKKKKFRKKQGAGTDFNSQITFVVRSSTTPVINGIIPSDAKIYKFKVFRTGKLQLPGVQQHLIDDAIACTKKIATMLNFHLHPGEENDERKTIIANINPVMKNYKFAIKMRPDEIIDLGILRQILSCEKSAQVTEDELSNERPDHPPIFMCKYTRQDTKLAIKFSTPIYKKPKKKTRINIFMRGKINILGAFNARVTRQICTYLHWIFEKHYNELIVIEGLNVLTSTHHRKSNIVKFNDNKLNTAADVVIVESNNLLLPNLPHFTDEECANIMSFINELIDEIISSVEKFLKELFEKINDELCLLSIK